jgi:hypothetical protein
MASADRPQDVTNVLFMILSLVKAVFLAKQ